MKTADWNDLKLGTVDVLDTESQPTPLGSQGQGLRSGYRARGVVLALKLELEFMVVVGDVLLWFRVRH